ncbi:sulfotransferase [bacterium]|nr:sulfotransferase [bacterium]
MKPTLFYQSSLPRAGSTLLQNILHENPEIYATPTDGVLELIFAARGNYTTSPEFKAQDSIQMQKGFLNFCKEGMTGFYQAITDRPYIMSKSRGWGIHYGLLNEIFPKPKIICMVRDLRDVYSSMEKNYRKNQHKSDSVLNWSEMKGTTTSKRIDIWSQSPPIGLAVERLGEMIHQGIDKNILFIKFEDLCNFPDRELDKIYEYLELPYFQHDVNNIKQYTQEDDAVYGIYGDHKIKSKLVPLKSNSKDILGKELCKAIYNRNKWFYDYFNYRF